jgi:formamidopyrimidine-DNA glycosylase
MPELPEVEMARRYLEKTSLRQAIKRAEIRDARILWGGDAHKLADALAGRKFSATYRHGKRLFLRLGEDLWLAIHLGMSGDFEYYQGHRREPHHTRLLISFEDGNHLAFIDPRLFGEVSLTRDPESFLKEKKIGPDALQLDLAGFLEIMGSRRGSIKGALLNQHLLAGLGNLYSDEALFQTGICPRARALSEDRLKRLLYSIHEVLRTAIDCEADLRELPSSYLIPHRYPGGRCPRDGSLLARTRVAGRTTFFCPVHQSLSRAPDQE